NRALRFVELDTSAIVRERSNRRRRGSVTIANTDFGAHWLSRIVERNPVQARRGEFIAQQFIVITNHDFVVRRVDIQNIQWSRVGDTNPAPLTNREAMNA